MLLPILRSRRGRMIGLFGNRRTLIAVVDEFGQIANGPSASGLVLRTNPQIDLPGNGKQVLRPRLTNKSYSPLKDGRHKWRPYTVKIPASFP